jgi:hypothetical protein
MLEALKNMKEAAKAAIVLFCGLWTIWNIICFVGLFFVDSYLDVMGGFILYIFVSALLIGPALAIAYEETN